MRIEVTIAKSAMLPAGAIDALAAELNQRINKHFPQSANEVVVRYAAASTLSVTGNGKEHKARVSEILQETWENADDWFCS